MHPLAFRAFTVFASPDTLMGMKPLCSSCTHKTANGCDKRQQPKPVVESGLVVVCGEYADFKGRRSLTDRNGSLRNGKKQ